MDQKVAQLEAKLTEAKRQREAAIAPQPARVTLGPSKKKKKGRKAALKAEDGVVVRKEEVFESPAVEQRSRNIVTVSVQRAGLTSTYQFTIDPLPRLYPISLPPPVHRISQRPGRSTIRE